MSAATLAGEIERERLGRLGLQSGQLCLAFGVVIPVLRRAEEDAARWRVIYRYGLRLVLSALEMYRAEHCGGET